MSGTIRLLFVQVYIDMNNLIDQLKNSNFEFFFLVVDNYLDINIQSFLPNFHQIYAYRSDNINSSDFCLEDNGVDLVEKNSGRLLSEPKVIEFIKNTAKDKQIVIIPFKPSSKIDIICKKNNWLKVSNPSSINRLLEDKIKFVSICEENNIPIIPNKICELTKENFQKVQSQLGQNLVIQTHFGWAGNSTHFASYWVDIENKIVQNSIVKISPLLDGYSLLNNCCLTKNGLIQSPPAVQYTGLSGLTTNMFATVGRQWPSQAPSSVQEKIKNITGNFSEVLKKYQYQGFFGLDFFVDQFENVYLLECNPRLTASFAFYTQVEIKANINPLFFYHLAEFLDIDYSIDIDSEQSRFYNKNIVGSEITKKNKESQTIQKLNAFEAFSDSCDPIIIKPEILNKLQ